MPEIRCRLSTIMGAKRLKIVDIHDKTGIARDTISALYHEKAKGVTFEVVGKLCAALNCQPGDLFEYIPDKKEESTNAAQV